MTPVLYGITQCDTIRKTRQWLKAHNVDYQFHDYRKQGLELELLEAMCEQLGWDKLLNKRGTTYRQLSQEQKDQLTNHTDLRIFLEYPAMIKRPIIWIDGQYHLGFNEQDYAQLFHQA